MELRQLEYYVAVVQHGSILQAASALNLSQPPLSVAMKQLEQELGTPLFFRGARRIQLTAAGERFYQRALDILSLTEDTRREITGYAQGQGGVLRALGGEWRSDLATERRLTTPRHYAYLKIGEGCDWKCGYCAIPLIRGPHVSVPMEQVLDEARRLAAGGVRELMVIAQDTTYYGVDLYGRRRLADLLTELCRIGGIEWIRLHYAYPTGFPDDVIEVMAHEPKICKYLDIPFQHISDAQLKAMKRRHTKADAYRLVERLRAAVPDIALRTTLLVGYPGETEADFAELLQFVDDVRFDRLGVFAYSEEEGTYSALHLKDDVPDEVKRRRVERIMERQKAISLDNNLRRVGRTERVVVDARQGDYYVCRTQYDSPEVDQELLIPVGGRRLRRGCFYEARITAAEEYDLYGELTERRKR